MNPTNINQMLWSNLIAASSANDICSLINATMSEHKTSDIVDMLNIVAKVDIPAEKIQPIIDVIEGYYIDGFTIDLAPYLSVLYHKNKVGYLSKYYLGLTEEITEDTKKLLEPLVAIYDSEAELECPAKSIAHYDFKREYIFQGQQKEYSVHSFSKSIGKNSTILKTPYGAIMFDCGAACGSDTTDVITEIELLDFFKSIDVSPNDLLAVVISHAHLDHYGSIATLINLGIDMMKIYIEEDTKALLQQVATGLPSIDNAFTINSFFHPRVKMSAFPNGHILGSTGYVITFDELNVVYTGDYCVHSQKTVPGLNVDSLRRHSSILKQGVDCLITETTYGRKSAPIEYENVSKVFLHFVGLLIKHGYKVFIPSFAIGRSQEIALLLNESYSVLIDGLAAKISKIYEDIAGIKIFNSRTRYNESFEDNKEENFDCNDIIIASSGMLSQNSTSYNYVKTFLEYDRKVAIIKTGYISSESYGNELLNRWKRPNDRLFDISLSAHADFEEIYTLISELEPKHIVCVHGDGLKSTLKPEMEEVLTTDPENSDDPKPLETNDEELEQTNAIISSEETVVEEIEPSPTIDETIDENLERENNIISSEETDGEEIESSPETEELLDEDLGEDDNPDDEWDDAAITIDCKVLEEVFSQPNELILSLIVKFVEAYKHTNKILRNAQRYDSNKKVCVAYYELYSYVRLHKEYKEFYNVLFSFGVDRGRIYAYLRTILHICEACEEGTGKEEASNDDPVWEDSSVLYVHKGTIPCQQDNHNVVAATAVLLGKTDQPIKLAVNYCKDCNRFFINYTSYEVYKNKYGILIGNIVLEAEGSNIFSDVMLAEESPLKLCGYSVNQQDGYSKETRWHIISKIIDRGIMSKSAVVRYLEYFIYINGKKKSNYLALSKWKEDLKFTLTYEANKYATDAEGFGDGKEVCAVVEDPQKTSFDNLEINDNIITGCQAGSKTIAIPDGIKGVGERAFCRNIELTSVMFSDGVSNIGASAFFQCDNLSLVSLPNGLTKIEWYAFAGCKALEKIEFPETVERIEDDVFYGCSNLVSVKMPKTMEFLGNAVFSECSSLKDIEIPYGIKKIGKFAFSNCKSLSKITIPNSVTRICACAFQYCLSLKEITIPSSVTEIEKFAFQRCLKLTIYTPKGSYAEQYAKEHGIPSKSI